MGIEHHRQRLPAALRMPKHAALAIGDSRFLGRGNRLVDSEVLMVSGKDFESLCSLVGKTNKVFDDIQQPLFLEHTLKEGIELGILRVFITAVFRFPLHKAIFTGGNRSGFGGELVAHHADSVIDEH